MTEQEKFYKMLRELIVSIVISSFVGVILGFVIFVWATLS